MRPRRIVLHHLGNWKYFQKRTCGAFHNIDNLLVFRSDPIITMADQVPHDLVPLVNHGDYFPFEMALLKACLPLRHSHPRLRLSVMQELVSAWTGEMGVQDYPLAQRTSMSRCIFRRFNSEAHVILDAVRDMDMDYLVEAVMAVRRTLARPLLLNGSVLSVFCTTDLDDFERHQFVVGYHSLLAYTAAYSPPASTEYYYLAIIRQARLTLHPFIRYTQNLVLV